MYTIRLQLSRALVTLVLSIGIHHAALAGGVTVITHGFNGNVEDWIIPMANQYLKHPSFQGTDITCYELRVRESDDGVLSASTSLLAGPQPQESDSGEIVVKLDWSAEAGLDGISSTKVAETAVLGLLDPDLIDGLNGRPLATLPLHLIGHSRGGSVVTEIARSLGKNGVWVDHVTTLDPVPVAGFGDAAVTTWENVLYADNFYQQLGSFLIPTGQAVFGAFNRNLKNLDGGYFSPHSDAHLWYHGTIDLGTPATDTEATITQDERSDWWEALESKGANVGFLYSRIGAGDRFSTETPGGNGTDTIVTGYNQMWDFGAGLRDNRTALPTTGKSWPNVIIARGPTTGSVDIGQAVPIEIYYQTATEGEAVLSLYLDPDRNPWNGNEILLTTESLPTSGSENVLSKTINATANASTTGSYAILAHLGQGEQSRYLYTTNNIEVTLPPYIDVNSFRFDDDGTSFTVHGSPGTTLHIEFSTDLVNWDTIATSLLESETWEVNDPETNGISQRFYRIRR